MNRFIFFLSLSLFIFSCDEIDTTLNVSRGLIINEFLASNDACCSDQNGDFDDFPDNTENYFLGFVHIFYRKKPVLFS